MSCSGPSETDEHLQRSIPPVSLRHLLHGRVNLFSGDASLTPLTVGVMQDKVSPLWWHRGAPFPREFLGGRLGTPCLWSAGPDSGSFSNSELKWRKPAPLLWWEFLGTVFYSCWIHLKYTRAVLEQRCSNCFQRANCTSSAMSPGDAREAVFHKVKKNK